MKAKLLLAFVVVATILAANYFFETFAQGTPAPQCQCQYPNGGGYGVLKPISPPVDGSQYTCEVKRCYLRVVAFDTVDEGSY